MESMSDAKGLKSRMDLLMERLAKEDAEGGAVQTLSDAQRAAITEIRSQFEARAAELEIMNQRKLAEIWDPESRELLLAELRSHEGRRDAHPRAVAPVGARGVPAARIPDHRAAGR